MSHACVCVCILIGHALSHRKYFSVHMSVGVWFCSGIGCALKHTEPSVYLSVGRGCELRHCEPYVFVLV